jgi:hypothetical protein
MSLNGTETPFKSADIYAGLQFSPDGNYLMITTIKRPFLILFLSRFPMTTEIFDTKGNLVKTVNDVPLNEIMPKGFSSVRTGKRNMSWRADKPASLYFVEALDGGDQSKKADSETKFLLGMLLFLMYLNL